MGKILTYTNITECCYYESTDELEYFGDDFDYEISYSELYDALTDIIYEDRFRNVEKLGANQEIVKCIKSALNSWISELDCTDGVFDEYEDDLLEYFKRDAFESRG